MQSIYLNNKRYSVENLPSEPSLLIELLDLCHSDHANFEMFAAAISKDAALSAKVLQVANSPAYRQWNKITDLRRMLIILGMTNIRNIVTTCAIQQFFSSFSRSFNQHVQWIWLRSLICANLAERLAKLTNYSKPGEAFLSGLLHQVGMLLLLINRTEDYTPLLERYYTDTEQFRTLEQAAFQLDHCQLGAALVDSWKMDSFIADAIQFQQAPAAELNSSPLLLKILAVAAPLSSKNSARDNQLFLEKAGVLFNMTEATILDCLDLAVDKSRRMILDLGFSGRFYLDDEDGQLFDEKRHLETTDKLAEQVKNIALSTTIGRSEKTEWVNYTREIRASFNTLFSIGQLLFFKADEDQTHLTAINDLELNQLEEIRFDLTDAQSRMVKAFSDRNPNLSLDQINSIADRQVIRLLGSEAAYFLPVHQKESCVGVLVIGTSRQDWPELEKKEPLLKLLSSEIAARTLLFPKEESQTSIMSTVDFRKVAHEISNPLTIINNYLYILGKKIENDHPAQEEIKFISEEIERAGNILLRAKDPHAPGRKADKRVDINQLVSEIDTLFTNSLYKTNRVESHLQLDQNIPELYCSRDKLKQVLLNIIKNAVEASADGGKIDISTRDNFFQNGRHYVELTISDDGPGIAEDILKNLFHPVTSTKEGHSGLGLSIVKTLMDEMSGSISCHSNQDEGTEFKIFIPRQTDSIDCEMDTWT